MFFFRGTRNYVNRSVNGLMDDAKQLSSKLSGKTEEKEKEEGFEEIFRRNFFVAAIVFALLIYNVLEKDMLNVIVFGALFIADILISAALLYSSAKKGRNTPKKEDGDPQPDETGERQ